MMLVFEPILLYTTNMNDFWFDFRIMIWPTLKGFIWFSATGIAIVTIIYFANLFFSGKVLFYKLFTLTGFFIFFLLYLQGNWLAGNLPELTGEPIIWENYGKIENVILTLAAVVLIAGVLISIWKFKLSQTIRYAAVGAGVVFIMLAVSLVPTVIESNALQSKDTFVPTLKNFNTISSNQNFLIFLLDTVDSKTFYNVMSSDRDFCEVFEDFTYFPDALSVFGRTRRSLPNILTGTVDYMETTFYDYSSSAYNQSPFFDKLSRNGYKMNLYSNSSGIIWGGNRNFKIDNSTSIYDTKVDLLKFIKEEIKYIQFKYLPYGVKQTSKIETLDFNTCRVFDLTQNVYYPYWNPEVYACILENDILSKENENYFQFVHCDGAHPDFNLDKDCNTIEGGTYEQKIAACLTMIKAYLQRLKTNDAYDNSIIVIMSDHGHQHQPELYGGPYELFDRHNPILFIKGVGEKHDMITSDRSVSYVDLQGAFCDLIDGKQSTELFAELKPGRVRNIILTWSDKCPEYETVGKAWEVEKFIPTGNVYDLD